MPVTPWRGSWAASASTIGADRAACYVYVDGQLRYQRLPPAAAKRVLTELGEQTAVVRVMQRGEPVAYKVRGVVTYVGAWADAAPQIRDPALHPGDRLASLADTASFGTMNTMATGSPIFEEALDLARRIAAGEDPVRRIVTMQWFTYEIEGEDVLFDDSMRAQVERAGGATLEEVTPENFAGDRVLRFPAPQLPEIAARLAKAS